MDEGRCMITYTLFYNYLINIIGEMDQKKFCESTKEDFLVIGSSVCAGIPIVEPYMDAVMAGIMPEGYEALVLPLVWRVYKDFLIGLCFCTLPVDNILFSPLRQIVENFLLQSYSAGGMYDVVHNNRLTEITENTEKSAASIGSGYL